MVEKIKLVDISDFEETDEDTCTLAIKILNNSAALLIKCESKSLMIHIQNFKEEETKLIGTILNELKKSQYKINEIILYIGNNCDLTNLDNFLAKYSNNIKILVPYINENGIESIVYDQNEQTTYSFDQIKDLEKHSKVLKQVI